jgi:hypothetical protein
MNKQMKVFVVGRHKPDFGDEKIEVMGQESATFPVTADECKNMIEALAAGAARAGADALIFQGMPGQVAAALVRMALQPMQNTPVRVGIVISVPGPRPAGVEKELVCTDGNYFSNAEEVAEVIRFANPRAKVDVSPQGVTVTVDPPMRFEFSHIEWLN